MVIRTLLELEKKLLVKKTVSMETTNTWNIATNIVTKPKNLKKRKETYKPRKWPRPAVITTYTLIGGKRRKLQEFMN